MVYLYSKHAVLYTAPDSLVIAELSARFTVSNALWCVEANCNSLPASSWRTLQYLVYSTKHAMHPLVLSWAEHLHC